MESAATSYKGSVFWSLEKIFKMLFVPSCLYIFIYFLLSYKLTGYPIYLNLFFTNLLNIGVMSIFMVSGISLSFLRFKAILEDYVRSFHLKLMLQVLFIGFNIFSFTLIFFAFIYLNFVISITTI